LTVPFDEFIKRDLALALVEALGFERFKNSPLYPIAMFWLSFLCHPDGLPQPDTSNVVAIRTSQVPYLISIGLLALTLLPPPDGCLTSLCRALPGTASHEQHPFGLMLTWRTRGGWRDVLNVEWVMQA
jgi:hypothetical protein